MKKSIYAFLLMLLLGAAGCSKIDNDFLETKPETFYTVDNIFTTSSQIDQAVIAIYSMLRDMWANPNEENWIFVFRGNGTDMYDVPSIRRGNTFNNYGLINANHANFYNAFSSWYQIIAKANLAIYSAELPSISWASPADKAYTVGQARFFRAFAYRNLAELFGGVPIVTDITKVARYDYTRATRVQTYQYAIDEMQAIENDMPVITAAGGRLVRGAVQHNLCELYLALGTQLAADGNGGAAQTAFAKSIEYGNKVIDGGTYSLMKARFGSRKTETKGNVYWDLFQENNVNYQDGNKECIWAIQIDYAAYKAEDPRSKLPYSRTIGILVDQATVTIENIHQHLEMGKNKKKAIYDACVEISFPLLLILLCILAVFAPSFLMTGVPKAMFLPLSLSIGFTMIVSYIAAQTLVPILSNWIMKTDRYQHYHHGAVHAHAGQALDREEQHQVDAHLAKEIKEPQKNDLFERIKLRYIKFLQRCMRYKKVTVVTYLLVVVAMAAAGFVLIGKDMMPKLNNGQFQMRIKAPDGTRLERTEEKLRRVLQIIDRTVDQNVGISSAYIGLIPSSYGTSNLYIFNTGTHEAVLQVHLNEHYKVNMDELKDALRKNIRHELPDLQVLFEPIDMTEKIMSQGASTPLEIRVAGKDLNQIEQYADKLVDSLKKVPYLRDVQIAQPLHFPVVTITIDRLKASQLGLNVQDIARSVTASTSSSRFSEKNQWLDEDKAYTYQVQVQIPEYVMNTMDELKEIPLIKGQSSPVLGDIAEFRTSYVPAEYDRSGPRRFLTVNANIYKKDLGSATSAVEKAIHSLGTPPKGLVAEIKGVSSLLTETLASLQSGLLFAILVIFLLLAANYQSVRLALTVLSTVPAVIVGSLLALFLTGSTLNLQSYMGMIMSTGVSVANAILIVTNAENLRLNSGGATLAAVTSASIRLRPILMTSLAMIAGMIPMASGMGESGEQSAPLGRAVIGGLAASTLAALFVLPQVFAWIQKKTTLASPSLLPLDNTDQVVEHTNGTSVKNTNTSVKA